jgi:glycosyltransferase involved in cell wall biosynthesis
MRVVHVDSAHEWRASQSQVPLTGQEMSRRGHEVTLACRTGGGLEARARAAGLDVRSLVFGGDLHLGAIWSLRRVLRDTRPDVVHVHERGDFGIEFGLPAGCRIIGNVAALCGHKDHGTLLAAMPAVMRAVPEARLLIVGEGSLRTRLESQARRFGLAGRCVFAGFRSDVDRLLSRFALVCLTSRIEALGTMLRVYEELTVSRPAAQAAYGCSERDADAA